ncbi:hypothetical protein SAMD00019534_013020, partial [Acytostelium subglobosum LB1]|uniref:hypothetical protein n=1 Tax=Acytostelium subglobosum LB1 TaxID=1410327 RepID=UPI000644B2FA
LIMPSKKNTEGAPAAAATKKTAAEAKATTPKVAKTKTASADGEKKKKKKKSDYSSFSTYIHKILKTLTQNSVSGGTEKKITMSAKSMAVMNSFVYDIFERIATEAGLLARKKKRMTLHSRDIQVAVRIILTGELAKHAIVQGMTAVSKYNPAANESAISGG